jgi:hypothetical protein
MLALVLVGTGVVGLSAGQAAPLLSGTPAEWSIVDSPNAPDAQTVHISGVTCVSPSDCWAVGHYDNDSAYQTLIERWDGTSWAIVSSPNTSATQYNVLSGVTCSSASDCWAVGSYTQSGINQTLIERWDGTSWTIVPSPNVNPSGHNLLTGVTCVSTSDCWAVGYYHQYIGGNLLSGVSIIERWDGTSWAIVDSPNPGPAQRNVLTGVTCVSAGECWVVGHQNVGGSILAGEGQLTGEAVSRPLIERWDGTSWAIVDSPNTTAAQRTVLTAVTCVSAGDCWAVGYRSSGVAETMYPQVRDITKTIGATSQTLVERWDGTSWAVVDSPNTGLTQRNLLTGVTCVSVSVCWAVGSYNNGTAYQTLIQRWNGTSWAIVSSANATTQDNRINGLTCVSATECWAAGTSAQGSLIERWNGSSWAVVPSPNPNPHPTMVNSLGAVTCISASDCWAVGYIDTAGNTNAQTLIQHWDGTSWAIVPSPSTVGQDALAAVTCVSATECWAVGSSIDRNLTTSQTLVLRWDGVAWAIVPSPGITGAQRHELLGVTCVSAIECWAVGYSVTGEAATRALIQRWDGTSWTIVASPTTNAAQRNHLLGVTCASATACWAVGYSSTGTPNQVPGVQTLIERWDGTSWAVVSSPNTSTTQYNALSDVTCSSASDCWAVGYHNNGTAYQTLTERWDGTSWTIVPSPSVSEAQNSNLYGVTCASASECWAIGQESTDTSHNGPLIQRWDGASWAIVDSPAPDAAQITFLLGVTCAEESECWAVGYYYINDSGFRTLTERYSTHAR